MILMHVHDAFFRRLKKFFLVLSAVLFLPANLSAGEEISEHVMWGIPCPPDQIVVHEGFVVGYSQKHRQALWISYVLRGSDVLGPKVKRKNDFQCDPAILINPVYPKEYRKTGFDKGHLAPAYDMAYSSPTMKESFYMSNMTPQIPGCNRGIWKRVENTCRAMAVGEDTVCIVTGPLFEPDDKGMGRTKITVPSGFYKVLLDMTPPMKMIGFIVPNKADKARVKSFVVTVDEVECRTGMDFFSALPDELENKLESEVRLSDWDAFKQKTEN